MITGVHTMFYSSEPDALRSFLRDKLGLHGTDVGEGWLIFDVPDAEMGCHPADPANGAPSGTPHVSFYCDDILTATIFEKRCRNSRPRALSSPIPSKTTATAWSRSCVRPAISRFNSVKRATNAGRHPKRRRPRDQRRNERRPPPRRRNDGAERHASSQPGGTSWAMQATQSPWPT